MIHLHVCFLRITPRRLDKNGSSGVTAAEFHRVLAEYNVKIHHDDLPILAARWALDRNSRHVDYRAFAQHFAQERPRPSTAPHGTADTVRDGSDGGRQAPGPAARSSTVRPLVHLRPAVRGAFARLRKALRHAAEGSKFVTLEQLSVAFEGGRVAGAGCRGCAYLRG
jgi:hypothetical protein